MSKRAAGRRTAANGSPSASAARLRSLEVQTEQNRRDLEVQLRRIAQIQAELDVLKARTALKMKERRGD